MKNDIKAFKDIEDQFSDIERSQKSTFRKLEDDKKDMLFKIVSSNEIEILIDFLMKIHKPNGKPVMHRAVRVQNTGINISHCIAAIRIAMTTQQKRHVLKV